MLFDLNSPNGFQPTNYDFCIAGAGVAGITCALELARNGAKVLLLEGGGSELSSQSQELYKAENIGLRLWPSSTRLRFFGGTSNHWAGRCRGFDPIDFSERKFYALPGWPIKKSEIDRHYALASKILDVSEEPKAINGTQDLNDFFVKDKSNNSAPTRFNKKYLDEIKNSTQIDLVLNANVARIVTEKSGSVSGMLVRNYRELELTVSAGTYILSMGALENARLLLVSATSPEEAPGNGGGMVGKCLMDHLNVKLGTFISNSEIWKDITRMEYATSAAYSQAKDIGSSNVTLGIVGQVRAYGRTRKIKEYFRELSCDWGFEKTLKQWVNFNCPGEGVVTTLCEQQPNPESRVYLSTELDALGMRKLIVDWKITDADKRTINTLANDIAIQIADANVGRMQLSQFITDRSLPIPVYHHSHHMGTTRMATSPSNGVVDENCKVFGTPNMYVAGSSVFSTGGAANPTLPIVQLTLRLVEHLVST